MFKPAAGDNCMHRGPCDTGSRKMPVTVAAAPGVGGTVGTNVGILPTKSALTRMVFDVPLTKTSCTFPGRESAVYQKITGLTRGSSSFP